MRQAVRYSAPMWGRASWQKSGRDRGACLAVWEKPRGQSVRRLWAVLLMSARSGGIVPGRENYSAMTRGAKHARLATAIAACSARPSSLEVVVAGARGARSARSSAARSSGGHRLEVRGHRQVGAHLLDRRAADDDRVGLAGGVADQLVGGGGAVAAAGARPPAPSCPPRPCPGRGPRRPRCWRRASAGDRRGSGRHSTLSNGNRRMASSRMAGSWWPVRPMKRTRPSLPGLHRRLQRAARSEDDVQVLLPVAQIVQLPQVQPVGAQPAQRIVQQPQRLVAGAQVHLGRQEHLVRAPPVPPRETPRRSSPGSAGRPGAVSQ